MHRSSTQRRYTRRDRERSALHRTLREHANAKMRKRVVAYRRAPEPDREDEPTSAKPKRHNPTWAELMRRGLDIDSLQCPKCRARMRFVASILRPAAIRRILRSLDLPTEPIVPAAARAPPSEDDVFFDVA